MSDNINLVRQLLALLSSDESSSSSSSSMIGSSSSMIGKYVIVRCRDAGVHAGLLKSYQGRECELSESRRLWYWKVPTGKGAFLSGVASHGLGEDCKIGDVVDICLTENCEIIACSQEAERSIRGYATHERS